MSKLQGFYLLISKNKRYIKKYKSNFESIKGFWHSIDNIKNINILKKNGNKKKYHETQKILKKLKLYEKK